MKRTWKHGLIWIVTGLCCFATVAEVDAGIIFRRRPGLFQRRGNVATSAQVATTRSAGMTVRGQTPDSQTLPPATTPAAPAQPAP
jgi:hypothetical protein